MSVAYVALGVLGLVAVIVAIAWLGQRAAGKAARSQAEAVAAKEVAEDARIANEVRADNASASDDALRERLRKWTRK